MRKDKKWNPKPTNRRKRGPKKPPLVGDHHSNNHFDHADPEHIIWIDRLRWKRKIEIMCPKCMVTLDIPEDTKWYTCPSCEHLIKVKK
ncbi:MAG TPA: hypothetical protein ENI23_17450 [bacterium]|nr:hypothetical protein [bacterium]